MKVKRFFAPDMRTGIKLVREELGPDAVILSNQRIAGGIEIVATVEYEASLQEAASRAPVREPAPRRRGSRAAAADKGATRLGGPERAKLLQQALGEAYAHRAMLESGQEESRPASAANRRLSEQDTGAAQSAERGADEMLAVQNELRTMRELLNHCFETIVKDRDAASAPDKVLLCERLVGLGLDRDCARSVADTLPTTGDAERDWKRGLACLSKQLPVLDKELIADGGTFALVGPSGAGKTTMIGKLATRYALKHGSDRVALVTTDSYRIAAHDQLRTFARIIDVPLRIVDEQNSLQKVLKSLRDRELVLIDTAGLGVSEESFQRQLFALRGCGTVQNVLVLPAGAQNRVLERACRAWAGLRPAACILTKLDECGSLGEALSVVLRRQIPVAYTSDGQNVPHDLHVARAHGLVSRAVVLADERQEPQGAAWADGSASQQATRLRAHG